VANFHNARVLATSRSQVLKVRIEASIQPNNRPSADAAVSGGDAQDSSPAADTERNFLGSLREGGSYNAERPKVLKINVDLMLHRARCARWEALRSTDFRARKALLQTSESRFRKCIEMDPQDGRAYVGLAKLIEKARRIDEARELYDQGSKAVGGDNAFIWQAWATLEEKQGNTARARTLFDAATAADKTHAAAWHGWGMLEKRAGNPTRARQLFLRGVQSMPPDRPNEYLYQSLAVLAAEMGRVEEARLYFRQGTDAMIGVNRSAAALWQAWGVLEVNEGNAAEVRRLFDLGLKDAPKNRFIWLAWGVFEQAQDNLERARYLLSTGSKLNPRDPALLQAWARLEAGSGDTAKARRLFKRGLKVDASHQPLWQAWGMMEWKLGNIEEARDVFQRGVWADPRNKNAARLFQAWGVLEGEEGNTSLSRQLFKCAVKADPSSLPSWQSWAALEESVGNERRADELRLLCMQDRTEEVMFGNIDETLASSILFSVKKIAKWFQLADNEERARIDKQPKQVARKLPVRISNPVKDP